jgi:hypothetical protein
MENAVVSENCEAGEGGGSARELFSEGSMEIEALLRKGREDIAWIRSRSSLFRETGI